MALAETTVCSRKRSPPRWVFTRRVRLRPPINAPIMGWRNGMRKALSILATIALVGLPLTTGLADTKEQERLENCGSVLEEIMNVPDDIPANLDRKSTRLNSS